MSMTHLLIPRFCYRGLSRVTIVRLSLPLATGWKPSSVSNRYLTFTATSAPSPLPTTVLITTAVTTLHDLAGLPWWLTIGASTLALRLALFPVAVVHRRSELNYAAVKGETARFADHAMKHFQELQEFHGWSREYTKEQIDRKIHKYMTDLFVENKCHPGRLGIIPVIYLASFISVSISLQRLCGLRNIWTSGSSLEPYDGMASEGLLWCPDFTVPDPYYVLPVLVAVVSLATIRLFASRMSKTMALAESRLGPGKIPRRAVYSQKAMVVAFVVFIPTICISCASYLPSAITWYLVVNAMLTIIQNICLLHPKVQERLKIPCYPIDEGLTFGQRLKGILPGIPMGLKNASRYVKDKFR